MEEMIEKLNSIHPLSEQIKDRIRQQSHQVQLQKGDFLVREGDKMQYAYYIQTGLMRMYYLKEGEEHIRQFFF